MGIVLNFKPVQVGKNMSLYVKTSHTLRQQLARRLALSCDSVNRTALDTHLQCSCERRTSAEGGCLMTRVVCV